MARYATTSDVTSYASMLRFDQLTSDSGAEDDTVILAACDAQSSFMDGYLMGRYATPITQPSNVMGVLKTHCVRLVLYALFQGRLLSEKYTSIINDRDITIKWLESIAANQQSIPGQDVSVGPSDISSIVGGSQDQVFGDGNILGQMGNIDYANNRFYY